MVLSRAGFLVVLGLFCYPVSASDYGTTGAIDTPTARMQPDATFTSTLAYDSRTQSYGLTYQAFPWLETTFRYTGFEDFFFWDRNYEAKIRLWEEAGWLPQVAVGVRDLVGTGFFGSEYIVASKRFDRFDVSLGMGWGRLAGEGVMRNPLTSVSGRFSNRSLDVGRGGTLALDSFFSGEQVGVFGSVQYRLDTPDPTALQLEYNPETLESEVRRGARAPSSPWSYGVTWEPTPGITLGLSHQHGDAIGLRLQSRLDTSIEPPVYRPPAILERSRQTSIDQPVWFAQLVDASLISGVQMRSAKLLDEDRRAEILIRDSGFRFWPDLIERMHVQASLYLPASVKTVDYLVEESGHRLHTIRLPRQDDTPGLGEIRFARDGVIMPPREESREAYRNLAFIEEPVFDLTLKNRLFLFDPDNPLGIELYLNLGGHIPLGNGWAIHGSYGNDVWDNLSQNDRESDSVLPRVRSDALRYLKEGGSRVDSLLIEHRGSAERYLHYRLFAGVLETMYSGVGAEVLYQPYQSRLAVGLSGAWAKQRAFDGGFDHLDYSVLTGHASLYWATPFNQYDAALHAGRYLAKDIGATLEIRRTFDNGWMVGLWGTLTDVPFDTFGEGSFDKGIFLRIPFDTLMGGGTRANYDVAIRPILRDGGARLEGYSGTLWWDLRSARHDSLLRAR